MDAFAQLRTSKGAIPTRAVIAQKVGEESVLAEADTFRFIPYAPSEVSGSNGANSKPHAIGSGLLQLSVCVEKTASGPRVSRHALLQFAVESGPIFGKSPDEPLADWASAAFEADLAITIQQVANGQKPVSALSQLENLVKERITDQLTGESFVLYDIARPCSASYLQWLGGTSLVRRERHESGYYYCFLIADCGHNREQGEQGAVELIVARFDHEMAWEGYRALCECMGIQNEQGSRIGELLGLHGDDSGMRPDSEQLSSIEEDLGSDDLVSLSFIVRSLIKAHLCDAYVDPFQADADTGYLSFKSYLSWLWFDFSKCLDSVKIGYCERCGKPFSLVGHRGKERRFCSAKCKTDTKNDRMRRRRDSIRERFLEGDGVPKLAAECLGTGYTKREAEAQVRTWLETWVELRHRIDEDVRRNGHNSGLLRRCLMEGLSGKRILSQTSRHTLGI